MSSLEPGLQPSFIFPSRHNTANFADGLRDVSSATQRVMVRPSAPTNIDLVTSLQTGLTRPPVLDKDVFAAKMVLPVEPPIYVQPGLAEGMIDLARLTNADQDIAKITSGNNAMKRGNYKAAEHIVGREATSDEINNRTFTPNIRGSQQHPNLKTHVDFISGTMGDKILSRGTTNMEKKIRSFRNSEESLINDIMNRLNIPFEWARELKTRLGYTGDSVLGYESSSPHLRDEVMAAAAHLYERIRSGDNLTESSVNASSILDGQNRPIHSGAKAARGEKQARKQQNQQMNESYSAANGPSHQDPRNPNNPYPAPAREYDNDRKEKSGLDPLAGRPANMDESIPNGYPGAPEDNEEMKEVKGPKVKAATKTQQMRIRNEWVKEKLNDFKISRLDSKVPATKEDAVRYSQGLLEKFRKAVEWYKPVTEDEFVGLVDRLRAEEDEQKENGAGPQQESLPTQSIPMEAFEERPYVPEQQMDQKDRLDENEFQGAGKSVAEELNRPIPNPKKRDAGELILNAQAVGVTQVNVPMPTTEELRTAKKRLGPDEVLTADAPYGGLTEDQYGSLQANIRHAANIRDRTERENQRLESETGRREFPNDATDQELYEIALRTIPGGPDYAYDMDEDDEKQPRHRMLDIPREGKEREEKKDRGDEMGRGLGRRTFKRKRFHAQPQGNQYERDDQFLPDTSSFGRDGAIVSGNLMRRTGNNAVPISAQIQVQETHQYTETPLRDWVRHPNYVSIGRPDPIPIAQNTGRSRGVESRPKKVKFGGYMLDHHKLLSQGVMSLSHPSGRKVKGMANHEVSQGLKKVIDAIVTGGTVSTRGLKAPEKLYLRNLLSRSAANVELGADVNVSPTQQLSLILGEIEAGNDATDLKTQLRKLLPQLKRSKVLSAGQVADISTHYL